MTHTKPIKCIAEDLPNLVINIMKSILYNINLLKFFYLELVANATLCGTLRESNKSKVETKNTNRAETTIVTRSRSMESFIDQRSWSQLLLDYGNVERFQEAFNQFLIEPRSPLDENNQDAEIWIQNVHDCVIYCLSKDVPEFILDRFKELSRKYIVQSKSFKLIAVAIIINLFFLDRLTWIDFR